MYLVVSLLLCHLAHVLWKVRGVTQRKEQASFQNIADMVVAPFFINYLVIWCAGTILILVIERWLKNEKINEVLFICAKLQIS
jgi:hypothetical protein